MRYIDQKLNSLQNRKTELSITMQAFMNRGRLMDEIYRLTGETKRVNVIRCSVLGGRFFDYGDTRKNWGYEVCFDYVLDNGEIFRVDMTDTQCLLMTKSHGCQHLQIDPANPQHHPAATVFYKLLKGNAKTYAKLDRMYFPVGDPSWEGSCLDKYWLPEAPRPSRRSIIDIIHRCPSIVGNFLSQVSSKVPIL